MKVLLVNKFFYHKGGSETYFFTMAEALQKNSHTVSFFSMQDEKNFSCEQSRFFVSKKDYNSDNFLTKFKDGIHLIYSSEAKRKMELLLEAEHPDLAVLNLVHRQLTLSILDPLKKHKIPVLFVMHDWVCVCPNCTMLSNGQVCEKCLGMHFQNCVKQKCVKSSFLKSFLASMEANIYKWSQTYNKVDLYIAPSVFLQQKLKESGFTHSPIIYLRNPLPPDTIYRLPKHTENYFLYFGRLSSEKGILTLLKAVCELQEPIELRMVGSGPQRQELEQFVRDNRLERWVSFLGFQTGKPLQDLIEQSKCVILPSEWYENCPYSVMEAMAKGRPCIVSDQGGLPELVENNKSGFVFEAHNVNSLRDAISHLIALDAEEYSRMCINALNKAKAEFNPDQYLKQLIEEFGKIKPVLEENNE